MIRSAFLSFYRSLTRHPLYAGLNLLGLSFGIAVFIVLSLFVRFETSYEQWLPNADHIYVLGSRMKKTTGVWRPISYAGPGGLLDGAWRAYPALLATRLYPVYPTLVYGGGVHEETGQLVDPDVFRIFDLPILFGDRQAALDAPDGIILSERMARKIFGRADVLGAFLYLTDDAAETGNLTRQTRWRVMAVTRDIPANSTLTFDMVRTVTAFRARVGTPYLWGAWTAPQTARTFMVLPSADVGRRMIPAIFREVARSREPDSMEKRAAFSERRRLDVLSFREQQLSSPHLVETLMALRVTAWLMLGVALVNYANLATVRAGLRLREVSLRSAHGAALREIAGQLAIEALLTGGAGLAVAFSLVEIGLPVLNEIAGLSLALDYGRDGGTILGICCTVLVGAVLAGLYPASVVMRHRSSRIFDAPNTAGRNLGSRRLRAGLTLVQFSVAGAFLIVVAGFAAQVRYMETSDLGYSRDKLLITGSMIAGPSRNDQIAQVRAEWRTLRGIEGITSGWVPGEYFTTPSYPAQRAVGSGASLEVWMKFTSPDFFKVYNTQILAGRPVDVSDDISWKYDDVRDYLSIPHEVMKINVDIDMTAVRAFGFGTAPAAVGQDIKVGSSTLHVVGVVADQRFQPPTLKMQPSVTIILSVMAHRTETIIRYSGIDEATARQRLEAVWQKYVPDLPFDLHSMREELDYYYRDDRRNTKLFAIGGGVAALIGAVGLFGMAAFSTSARVHEIGIRKSVGASRWRIVRLLMFQFLRPVLVANLIAWPVAYLVLDAWLKQFDDRVAMSPWFFLAGSGLSLLIAAVTVVGVAVSAARLSPARALRQL